MRALYLWPQNPALSLVALWVATQALLYAARVPVHRALRGVGTALGGGLRLAARWLGSAADELRLRNREVLLEAGRLEAQARLEREFARLTTTFTTDLRQYPGLHRRLDECAKKIEEDLKASSLTPPEAPGWPAAVQAIAVLPRAGDRAVQRVLEEIQKAAEASDRKALQEYRAAVAGRHRILARSATLWKVVRSLLDQVQRTVAGTLETAGRIDAYMERYEKIRRGEDAAEQALAASSLNLFVISSFVVAVAGFGGLVNFQLIARPMSELVPGGGYVLGMPISMIAALVIVLMEVAAGIFAMETLGITHLFPRLGGLAPSRRRIIFAVALTGLALLAAVEASLAVLREQLLEADKALALALAGEAVAGKETVAAPLLSRIPMLGQAVLGFILPWILALIAVPLEMLVESGRHVIGRALVLAIRGAGVLLRLLGHGLRHLAAALVSLYDIYIIVPLQLERLARGRGPQGRGRVGGPLLRNPADHTGPVNVQR